MRYRLMGHTGLRVSELFLGAMAFGEPGGATLEECRRMIDLYADHGGNVIDTAVTYLNGSSETFTGEALAGRRDRFIVATKYGMTRDPSDPNAAGSHRKNLMASLETSLRQLRTDYIDLYWVHFWDPHTPIEETMRALDDAVRSGKVLSIGMSDSPAWVVARSNTLAEWRGSTPFAAIQAPYNLFTRDIERDLLPMAHALSLSIAAWSPLAKGALAGRTDRQPNGSQRGVLRTLHRVATDLGATRAQVAIAWTMHRTTAVHPIIGARTVAQLRDNLAAADVRLPEDAARQLDAATGFRAGFPTDFLAEVTDDALGVGRRLGGA